jgi:hypothetical protein
MVKGQMVSQDESPTESCLHCEINDLVQEHIEGQELVEVFPGVMGMMTVPANFPHFNQLKKSSSRRFLNMKANVSELEDISPLPSRRGAFLAPRKR